MREVTPALFHARHEKGISAWREDIRGWHEDLCDFGSRRRGEDFCACLNDRSHTRKKGDPFEIEKKRLVEIQTIAESRIGGQSADRQTSW